MTNLGSLLQAHGLKTLKQLKKERNDLIRKKLAGEVSAAEAQPRLAELGLLIRNA